MMQCHDEYPPPEADPWQSDYLTFYPGLPVRRFGV
nr:MAG TPA: hypothetical protein [Caudoviricetes sp.]